MLKPLRSERRRALLRGSLFALGGALLLMPLALPPAEPASAAAVVRVPPSAMPPTESPEPNLVVARDPFVPDAAVRSADASPGENGDGAGIVLVAVALGDAPRALVRSAGASRIVRVGDAIGDSSVRSIGERGLVLQSGETLPLAVPR